MARSGSKFIILGVGGFFVVLVFIILWRPGGGDEVDSNRCIKMDFYGLTFEDCGGSIREENTPPDVSQSSVPPPEDIPSSSQDVEVLKSQELSRTDSTGEISSNSVTGSWYLNGDNMGVSVFGAANFLSNMQFSMVFYLGGQVYNSWGTYTFDPTAGTLTTYHQSTGETVVDNVVFTSPNSFTATNPSHQLEFVQST